MNFFETLKETADSFKIDIKDEIEFLKTELKSQVHKRCFEICLIKTTTTMIIGHGHGKSCVASFFVPEGISPTAYRNEFIKEFVKLGFDESYIKTDETEVNSRTVFYNIYLKW